MMTTEQLLDRYDELREHINENTNGEVINEFEEVVRELAKREEM